MSEIDELRDTIRKLDETVQRLHGAGKPWYARSPFKEAIAHAFAVAMAVSIGVVIHRKTGEPIVIEAKNAPPAEPLPVQAAVQAASVAAIVAYDVVPDAAPTVAAAAPVVSKRVKAKPVPNLQDLLAAAPAAAPAAPAAAAGAPAGPAPPPKKVIMEIPVGGRAF